MHSSIFFIYFIYIYRDESRIQDIQIVLANLFYRISLRLYIVAICFFLAYIYCSVYIWTVFNFKTSQICIRAHISCASINQSSIDSIQFNSDCRLFGPRIFRFIYYFFIAESVWYISQIKKLNIELLPNIPYIAVKIRLSSQCLYLFILLENKVKILIIKPK